MKMFMDVVSFEQGLRGPISKGIKLEARLGIPEVTRARLRVESDRQLGQQGGRLDTES
jgi:hypothetical protein